MNIKLLPVGFVGLLVLMLAGQTQALSVFDNLNIGFLGSEEQSVDKTIWQDGPNRYVKLTSQDTRMYGPNQHPVTLEQRQVNIALAQLRIARSQAAIPVFTEEQVSLLSIMLATGLKEASAAQDVVFALEKSESKMMGLKGNSYFVAGRAFYKDGRLNLIIGDYDRVRNIGYEAAYDPSKAGIVSYSFEYGKRTKVPVGSHVFNKKTVEVPGIANRYIASGPRLDWFEIDLNEAAKSFVSRENIVRQQVIERKREDIKALLGADYQLAAAPPVRSIEERLTDLQSLKDKGLITEQEYQLKRKKILDDL